MTETVKALKAQLDEWSGADADNKGEMAATANLIKAVDFWLRMYGEEAS